MKKLIVSILLVVAAAMATRAVAADGDIVFDVSAPMSVEAGEPFRVEFSVNATKVEFIQPAIEGIEILAGPQESRSSNVQLINGEFSQTSTTTYTYVLQAITPGLHTIPAARVTVKGRTYSTRPVTIEVVGEAAANGNGGNGGSGGGSSGSYGGAGQNGNGSGGSGNGRSDTPKIAADDIFIRATVNHTEVYKGEPIVVTLKLYSRVRFMVDNLKLPAFNGFWQQDIRDEATEKRETYNNRVYNTWTLDEYLLYPQQAGKLTIDPFDATVTVQLQVRNAPRSIFDEVMGGVDYQEFRKKIATEPIRINVHEWPGGAPASFNGAVGQFEIAATPPPSAMNANTSGTYALKLSGTGNFPLIRAPKLDLPDSFEKYNVTTSDNTRHTHEGTTGHREFSYPFIPRTEGTYTIPAFEFSFLDPRQGRYVTLSSREMTLEVAADSTAVTTPAGGIVSGLSREELKIFGEDIRFIKRSAPGLHPRGRMFMFSPLYISLMALLVGLFVAGYLVLRGWVRNMQSDRFVRGKRANKMALRRFRAAEAAMKQDDRHGFWGEMLAALWGYMSDKLDIPPAGLTKERVREELFERNVGETQADEYIRIISECEEAQYSPVSSTRMNELYHEGVALVSELESVIKLKATKRK